MSAMPNTNNINNGYNIGKEYQKANAAINMGRFDLVITLMRGVLQVEPEAAPAFLKLAYAHLQRKEYELGVQACQEGVRLDPENDYAHALFGELLYKYKRYAEAEREFNAAIAINPQRALNHYWYADYLLLFKRDLKRAEIHAAKAIEIAPQNADYHVLMGMVRTRQNIPEQAVQEYKVALSIDPEHHYAINNYGVYLMNVKRRPKEAVELFRQALVRNPNEPLFLSNLKRAEAAARSIFLLVRQFNGWFRQKIVENKKEISKWGGATIAILFLICLLFGFVAYREPNLAMNLIQGITLFFDIAIVGLLVFSYITYILWLLLLTTAGIGLFFWNTTTSTIKNIRK